MSRELATVDFHGDKLRAVEQDGKVLVAVRPLCDALGIDHSRQIRVLRAKAWATVVMMSTVAEDGKSREMACLDVDSIPMWLAGIEPAKVAERVRPKLLLFQLEAHRALRDHFLPHRREVYDEPTAAGPLQARIGDDAQSRGLLYSLFRAASAATGRTVQSLHGEVRKPWGVASVYRIALSALPHTVARVEGLLYDGLKISRLPARERQLALRYIEGGARKGNAS